MKRIGTCLMAIAVFSLSACATLPQPPRNPPTRSLPPASAGTLAEAAFKIRGAMEPGQSGFLYLAPSFEAMKWRLALIDHATSGIDAQYFIWQSDEAGRLLFDRLLRAADRGVKVRLLVDDLGIATNDRYIAAICMHPNFDVKIFNPGRIRGNRLGAVGEFLFNFKKLNRRMHNKLLIVDNQMAIVGGRNIGNEYFGLGNPYNFRDIDVLTAGPVIEEISKKFDDYWNAELAYPGRLMSKQATPEDLAAIREYTADRIAGSAALLAAFPTVPKDWTEDLFQLSSLMSAGEAHFIQDEPVGTHRGERLVDLFNRLAAPSYREVTFVTPYLLPVGDFLKNIARLAVEGVHVKIITGSMGANNHTVAHSHYKKYRRPILATGTELYEFRHDPSTEVRRMIDVPPSAAEFICLHVKAVVGDRERCFMGSLNLDPRAIKINTENGLYIESEGLCGQLADDFDDLMAPENAWRVTVEADGRLRWRSAAGNTDIQPARSFGQRIADFFLQFLPIGSQL